MDLYTSWISSGGEMDQPFYPQRDTTWSGAGSAPDQEGAGSSPRKENLPFTNDQWPCNAIHSKPLFEKMKSKSKSWKPERAVQPTKIDQGVFDSTECFRTWKLHQKFERWCIGLGPEHSHTLSESLSGDGNGFMHTVHIVLIALRSRLLGDTGRGGPQYAAVCCCPWFCVVNFTVGATGNWLAPCLWQQQHHVKVVVPGNRSAPHPLQVSCFSEIASSARKYVLSSPLVKPNPTSYRVGKVGSKILNRIRQKDLEPKWQPRSGWPNWHEHAWKELSTVQKS